MMGKTASNFENDKKIETKTLGKSRKSAIVAKQRNKPQKSEISGKKMHAIVKLIKRNGVPKCKNLKRVARMLENGQKTNWKVIERKKIDTCDCAKRIGVNAQH